MAKLFDAYGNSYRDVVQASIDFSGLLHDFFMQAKADLLRNKVAAHFGAGARPTLLDVGCGVGAFHPFVRNDFARLCGTDVSEQSIAQARIANPAVDYQAYDGRVLPYADAAFDLVFAACVMHHVPPAQWPAFVREAQRVVRPGGLVCIVEHNPFNPLTRLAVSRCPFDVDVVLLRAGQARLLLRDAGLCNVDSEYFLLLRSAAPLARRVEGMFSGWPLGAQYMAFGEIPAAASVRRSATERRGDESRAAA